MHTTWLYNRLHLDRVARLVCWSPVLSQLQLGPCRFAHTLAKDRCPGESWGFAPTKAEHILLTIYGYLPGLSALNLIFVWHGS